MRKYIPEHDLRKQPADRAQTQRVMTIMQSKNPKLYKIPIIRLNVEKESTLARTLSSLSSVA